jgi:hypothetical protein
MCLKSSTGSTFSENVALLINNVGSSLVIRQYLCLTHTFVSEFPNTNTMHQKSRL